MKPNESEEYLELEQQSLKIKEVLKFNQEKGYKMIMELLCYYPHAPQPQNLLGIYAEKHGDILLAMKHYRAEEKNQYPYFCDQDVEVFQQQKKKKI